MKKNIKDAIMMPPPKCIKSIKSQRSDPSEELTRNLISNDNLTNISDNSAVFLEEINRQIKESHEEILNRRDSNHFSNHHTSGYKSSQINFKHVIDIKEIHSGSEEVEQKNAFKFNLINYNYSGSNENFNNNSHSQKHLEKLKKNLTSYTPTVDCSELAESKSTTCIPLKCFNILPKPENLQEIKYFVENMLLYMKDNDAHSSLIFLKIKLQTRYNDYKNKGLRTKYFKDRLMKMQKELISKIYQYSGVNAIFENGNSEFKYRKICNNA